MPAPLLEGDPPTPPPAQKPAGGRATGHVTLHDVARIAGVSAITVSRVLNQPGLVRPATVERVRQAIARTAYVPNLLAGGLASRRTRLVAAIVPSIANTVFSETVQTLTDRMQEAGYQVILGLAGYPPVREEALLSAILSRRPDGLLLTGVAHSKESRRRLMAANIPIVETWDWTPTPIDMLVGFSHQDVGRAVAEQLLAAGRRRIGLVSADDERALRRRDGFVSALARHGITDVPQALIPAPGTFQLGRQGLARLFETGANPEAVFCSSDVLAHGALVEAQARGLTVPGDLAVMGLGDLDFAAHLVPTLSTVRLNRAAIANVAADLMLARIEGRPIAQNAVDIGFELIARGST